MAAIFGKTMPAMVDERQPRAAEVLVQ
jgi:hypothetical protein